MNFFYPFNIFLRYHSITYNTRSRARNPGLRFTTSAKRKIISAEILICAAEILICAEEVSPLYAGRSSGTPQRRPAGAESIPSTPKIHPSSIILVPVNHLRFSTSHGKTWKRVFRKKFLKKISSLILHKLIFLP